MTTTDTSTDLDVDVDLDKPLPCTWVLPDGTRFCNAPATWIGACVACGWHGLSPEGDQATLCDEHYPVASFILPILIEQHGMRCGKCTAPFALRWEPLS